MTEQKVPAGTIEVRKKAEDLKLGLTTIILSAEDEDRLRYCVENINKIPEDFNCEIICISTGTILDEEEFDSFRDKVTFLCVPENITKAGLQNIGRQLASKDSKYLLFLDDFSEVSKEWLEGRVKGFEFNPIIGIIGRNMPRITEELSKKLFNGLQGLIRLSEDDYKERCCDKEGGFRNVCMQSLATPTSVFDRIGGLDIFEEYPEFVYQARVQALGYGIVPHVL
jgi:hypothetical protein